MTCQQDSCLRVLEGTTSNFLACKTQLSEEEEDVAVSQTDTQHKIDDLVNGYRQLLYLLATCTARLHRRPGRHHAPSQAQRAIGPAQDHDR